MINDANIYNHQQSLFYGGWFVNVNIYLHRIILADNKCYLFVIMKFDYLHCCELF